jgi:hypothetical protein
MADTETYYQEDLLKEDDELWRMHDKLDKEQDELLKRLADWRKDAGKFTGGWKEALQEIKKFK